MDNVDQADLRRVVDGRWAGVRERVRRTVPPEWCEPAGDLPRDEHRARTVARACELAATGLPGLGFEKAYGGDDDIGGSLTFFEMLGLVDLSVMVKAGVQWGLFGAAIQALGTERHHERYLPAMMTLELPGCFAMTETGHGSDVQSLRTTATYDPGTEEFVVTTPDESARKDYIGNAARDGRLAVVFAQLVTQGENHGVHAVLVPIRDEQGNPCPDVRIEDCGHKGGLNGVDNGRLWFDDVRVPRDNLLDHYGAVAPDGTYSSPIESRSQRFFTMLGALVRGRISVGGAAASAATVAVATALRYGEVRTQFARPGGREVVVLDYLAHQRRLLPALATSYALHFANGQLVSDAHDIQTGGTTDEAAQRELESRAAGLKVLSTWHATATIQTCREACGGAGYLSASRLVGLKADTDVFATFEGDNTVLLQLVARAVLTRYRDHFGDLDAMSTLRFLADQVKETVLEKTSARGLVDRLAAAAPGRGDADVLDRAWQLDMFAWREAHIVAGLARRLRRASSANEDDPDAAFEALNRVQPHALAAGRAHVHRIVLDAFAAAVGHSSDEGTRDLLDRTCDLYALAQVEADRAWFLEHGRLTPTGAKALGATVDDLCRELRGHVGVLVEGLGIPEEWLPTALG
ncbi:MAG TPA: acyl-CoA dehydrogenase [Actinomycetes bacterium]|jgi:acyl-CoA oxidase|nr:acyl-CoA dehydrogenase [Actinomycetes bacterium]